MFTPRSDTGYLPALDGIERKTLAYGALTLMTEFRLRKGSRLPRHRGGDGQRLVSRLSMAQERCQSG